MKYFHPKEFACSCCGNTGMQTDVLEALDMIRESYGKPMVVSSGYRCPVHPSEVFRSSAGRIGEHTQGLAADIAVSGSDARDLVKVALDLSVPRIGVNQKGSGRFIHLGFCQSKPAGIWSY